MNPHSAHNTVSALVATAVLLVVALISAAPVMPGAQASRPVVSEMEATVVLAAAIEQAASTIDSGNQSDPSRSTRKNTRDYRRKFAMPYFPFVPRG